ISLRGPITTFSLDVQTDFRVCTPSEHVLDDHASDPAPRTATIALARPRECRPSHRRFAQVIPCRPLQPSRCLRRAGRPPRRRRPRTAAPPTPPPPAPPPPARPRPPPRVGGGGPSPPRPTPPRRSAGSRPPWCPGQTRGRTSRP